MNKMKLEEREREKRAFRIVELLESKTYARKNSWYVNRMERYDGLMTIVERVNKSKDPLVIRIFEDSVKIGESYDQFMSYPIEVNLIDTLQQVIILYLEKLGEKNERSMD